MNDRNKMGLLMSCADCVWIWILLYKNEIVIQPKRNILLHYMIVLPGSYPGEEEYYNMKVLIDDAWFKESFIVLPLLS